MKKTKPRLGDSICNAHNLQRIDIHNVKQKNEEKFRKETPQMKNKQM